MRFRIMSCALVLVCMIAVVALAGEKDAAVVTAGAAIGNSPMVSLDHVMKYPEKYLGKTVVVTGVAAEVCQKKGCWLRLTGEDAEKSIRMTFKDYGFFVPMDAGGMTIRAEGVFEVSTLDKEHAEHLGAEGAKVKLNADGTATELGFVANGVELRQPKKKKATTG